MNRARPLLPLLTGLVLALAGSPPDAPAAEKKNSAEETKPAEPKKKASKEPASKRSGAGGAKGTKPETAPPAPPKDVTNQKAGRPKGGDATNDSKTMEGNPGGEFEGEDLPQPRVPAEPEGRLGELLAPRKASLAGWELVRHLDREYVTASNMHAFYHFPELRRDGSAVWFLSQDLIMKAMIGSQDLLINNIKFVLSYPVEESKGKVLFSRLDLCKLIDPVLRPSYIGISSVFDTVIIDAGHGGHDSGARGIYGYEKDFALKLAVDLRTEIERRNLKVVLTRRDDSYISLGGRVEFANRIPNSIFVSLHFNSGGISATGIETYALSPQGSSSIYGPRRSDGVSFNGNQRDSENIALATAVHAAVVHRFKMVDRGVKRARWYVLTGLERPGILFEGGFVTHSGDAKFVAADNYRRELARTIGDAIMNYRRALEPRR